jgi:hypothetical protein
MLYINKDCGVCMKKECVLNPAVGKLGSTGGDELLMGDGTAGATGIR